MISFPVSSRCCLDFVILLEIQATPKKAQAESKNIPAESKNILAKLNKSKPNRQIKANLKNQSNIDKSKQNLEITGNEVIGFPPYEAMQSSWRFELFFFRGVHHGVGVGAAGI